MKVLMIGGTGNISSWVTREAVGNGYDVYHLNRGTKDLFDTSEVTTLKADTADEEAVRRILADHSFDAVVDWLTFTPDQAERAVRLYRERAAHYVFISSATVYQKPPATPVMTESTPRSNPFHQYARDKAACEDVFTRAREEEGFPLTIVRPSHTYGDGWLPTPFGSADYTVARRIMEGKEIIIHGDGQSLWTLTHASDFARALCPLMGNPLARGESFHITSDEYLTWESIVGLLASYLGKEPRIVHMPTDFIYGNSEKFGSGIKGDKCYSLIFDNSKIKRFVPGWQARIPFARGLRENLESLLPWEENLTVQAGTNEEIEKLLELYRG